MSSWYFQQSYWSFINIWLHQLYSWILLWRTREFTTKWCLWRRLLLFVGIDHCFSCSNHSRYCFWKLFRRKYLSNWSLLCCRLSYARSCPPGTYNNVVGQSHCLFCPSGHFCPVETTDSLWLSNRLLLFEWNWICNTVSLSFMNFVWRQAGKFCLNDHHNIILWYFILFEWWSLHEWSIGTGLSRKKILCDR